MKIRIAIVLLFLGIGIYAYKTIQAGRQVNAAVARFATSLDEPQELAKLKESVAQVSDEMREARRSNEKTRNTAFVLVCLSGLLFTYEHCRHGTKTPQQGN